MKACVDIGGTKVSVALAGPGEGVRPWQALRREPTVTAGAPDALACQVIRMVDAVCADAGIGRARLQAVGVASCGPFARRDGGIELVSPNLCGGLAGAERDLPNIWTSVPLEAPLRAALPEVRIENDAVAALRAERRWGALRGSDHCAYVTWSTGVGVGLCVDGQVLRGKNGNAGHAGHSFVSDGAPDARCGCGNVGDVEALVAGSAMPLRFGRSAAALLTAAEGGEASALQAVDGLCVVLGRMLYNLVVTLDLERIALGGGVFWHHRDLLLPRLRAQLWGRLPAVVEGATLLAAGLGPNVGDLAALALVD